MARWHKGESAEALKELERFQSIRYLRNHWASPSRPRSYYWYLTFENCEELHSLARKCQEAIAFPYYDLIPPRCLHLSLDRIAFEDALSGDQLNAIKNAAGHACQQIASLDFRVGALGGTRGAIGFAISPAQRLKEVRDALRTATLSVYPDAPVTNSEFRPHITIAYANSDDVPAAEAIAAVEKLNAVEHVDVTIKNTVMVLLERRVRAYAWQEISRIPFAK